MRDECCNSRWCAQCLFLILDPDQKQIMGKIQKDHRNGKRIKPDYDQIVVIFLLNASCKDKILIMCAALVLGIYISKIWRIIEDVMGIQNIKSLY